MNPARSRRRVLARALVVLTLLFGVCGTLSTSTSAWASPPLAPPPGAAAVTNAAEFDPQAATDAYLATVNGEARERSDSYFEGGYWLLLWDFLASAVVALVLLRTRLSARMRDAAAKVTRFRFVHGSLYWLQYIAVVSIVELPLTLYEGFFREHKYGLSTQTFGAWMGDQGKALVISAVLGALLVPVFFAAIRRAGKRWWLVAAVLSIVVAMLLIAVTPVYLAPVFNDYTELKDESIRQPILALARANGIDASHVYQFDASKQSNRVSANVSGLFGTERISLNDNLLNRCSPEEIFGVLGHEMGHYVMHHIFKSIIEFGILILIGFAAVDFFFTRVRARYGERWGIGGVDDVASLPLLGLLFSVYTFLLTPVFNTMTRTQELEADLYGLNAAQQPDGEAQVDLKLGDYRKLDPGPLEEMLFFDHPSGRTRIFAAMRWKKEHMAGGVLHAQ